MTPTTTTTTIVGGGLPAFGVCHLRYEYYYYDMVKGYYAPEATAAVGAAVVAAVEVFAALVAGDFVVSEAIGRIMLMMAMVVVVVLVVIVFVIVMVVVVVVLTTQSDLP